MYKLDFTQNVVNSNKQLSNKSRLKQSKEVNCESNKSRQFKQNDSKHLNSIKPYVKNERKNSKREIQPSTLSNQINRSKSKKYDSSNRKGQQCSMISCQNLSTINPSQMSSSKQLNQICQQLVSLKKQYKFLKTQYNTLIKQKQEVTSRQQNQRQNHLKQKSVLLEDMEKIKKSNLFLENQIQRIKRQCFKILQSQKYKNKKLQQTLQQKQLMISYLRSQNQQLKKNKDLNCSQQQNLQKIFFLQNSAPIFSYESYARLSANTSTISGINNVFIDQRNSSNQNHQQKNINNNKKGDFQEDSLSFSRERSKQFDSVHSLLSNHEQTILTFTKKDVVVLDESFSDNQNEIKLNQNEQCLTFQNRKNEGKQIISFQKLKQKNIVHKSQLREQYNKEHNHTVDSRRQNSKKIIKNSQQHTKRLQILTQQFKGVEKQRSSQQNSCETKKKYSRPKGKGVKKHSKMEGCESLIINEMGYNTFNKKNSNTKNSNVKKR